MSKTDTIYAIIGRNTGKVIGTCVNKADVLREEPGALFFEIPSRLDGHEVMGLTVSELNSFLTVKNEKHEIATLKLRIQELESVGRSQDVLFRDMRRQRDALQETLSAAGEAIDLLESAGFGKPGTSNTLLGMVEKALSDIHAYKEIVAALEAGIVAPLETLAVFEFEQESKAFEMHAKEERLDVTQHPLHYLFLSRKTQIARQAWKDAIAYCRAAVAGKEKEPLPEPATVIEQLNHERIKYDQLEQGHDRLLAERDRLRLRVIRFGNPWTLEIQNQTTKAWHEHASDAPLSLSEAERRLLEEQAQSPNAKFRLVVWFNNEQRQHIANSLIEHGARIKELEEQCSRWADNAIAKGQRVETLEGLLTELFELAKHLGILTTGHARRLEQALPTKETT